MVVERFASYVQKLIFTLDDINITDYDFIMRSMVNVTEVYISGLNIQGNDTRCANKAIELPLLKKLVLEECEDAIILRMHASSLEEFRVLDGIDCDFTQFFENHKTIKRVTMYQAPAQPKAFDHLQLTHLQIYNCSNCSHLRDIIAHQPKLQYLNLFKVGIGQVSPDAVKPALAFANLKQLVIKASDNVVYSDYDDDYDVNQMGRYAQFQKIFRNLISIPMPTLQSFTWSSEDCEVDDEYFFSDDEEMMVAAHRREFAPIGDTNINVFNTMAKYFPNLKFVKIDMKTSEDIFNIHSLLHSFPNLETINLKLNSVYEGDSIQMHGNIKHIKIRKLEQNVLTKMMHLTPNLESLEISDTKYSLKKSFLVNLQSTVPNSLKEVALKFHSSIGNDFGLDNIKILQEIIKNLKKCRIKLTGCCNFDSLSEKIDRSIDKKMGISLPRSLKGYYPGDDWENHESYMELWKSDYV